MPCCTYVNNTFGGEMEAACHSYQPGDCSTVFGWDGESVQTHGLEMHGCHGNKTDYPTHYL